MRSSTFLDSVPRIRCRGKDPSAKTPLWTFITVFFLSIFLNLGVQGQNLYTQCTGCTSEDVKATTIRFDPPANASCLNSDQFFDATLYVGLDVTSATRYGLYIEFYIEADGKLFGDAWPANDPTPYRYAYCVRQDLPQGQYEIKIGTLPGLPGGTSIRLVDVFTGWENQDPDVGGGDGKYFCDKLNTGANPPVLLTCKDIDKPRCKTYAFLGETVLLTKPTVTVTGPKAVCTGTTGTNFTVSGTASTDKYEIELYYSFTGGEPYTKVDNFDGSELIPANSPFTVSQTLTAYLVRVKEGDDPCPGQAKSHTINASIAAIVDAGLDKDYCTSGSPVSLDGSFGGGASSAKWSGGNGTFSNVDDPKSTYIPSAGEVEAGTVTLTLTTNDPDGVDGPCLPKSDVMTITISKAVVTKAGDDREVCSSSPKVKLAGEVTGGSTTGTWSGGTGKFSPNETTLDAEYTPSADEIAAGTVTLTLTSGDPVGLCEKTSDQMTIKIFKEVKTDAGKDLESCSTSPTVKLAGVVSGGATTGTWSGGGGKFTPDANTLNAEYTPSADEITAGTVTLTLTSSKPSGPCPATTDQVVIKIYKAVVTNAGKDETVCAASPKVVLGGSITGGATTGEWIGGTGTFDPGRTSLTATYTPSADEIKAGTVKLILKSVNPLGPCEATEDDMTITINANSSADAGKDQDICADTKVKLAAISTPSTGSWSGGAGNYWPNNSDPNAEYTPSTEEKMAGSVTLKWTTTEPDGPCEAASDEVKITIFPIVEVDAGKDVEVCSSSPAVMLAGSIKGGTTKGEWVGGTGMFDPGRTTLNAKYTPSADEISAGKVTLTLKSNEPDGPCAAKEDAMTITISKAAIADAGKDQTVCASDPVQLAGTVSGGASSGTWTGGGGKFDPNATTGNAKYYPTPDEKFAGSVTLTWTTNDPAGECGKVSDDVKITLKAIPTVEAGNPQTTCVGVPVTLTATNLKNATGVEWSAPAGSGSFSDAKALTTQFTPSITGDINITVKTTGHFELCAAATDVVVVTSNTCATGYCTYTQGGFGNEGGKDSYKKGDQCIKSTGATMTVTDALNGWKTKGGMKIGNMVFTVETGDDVKDPAMTDMALIIAYLPNGGPSKPYQGTKANLLKDGDKNTLLAQTMTLGLNLGLNSSLGSFVLENKWLVTASSDDCGETPDGLTTQCFKFSVSSGMDTDKDGKVTVLEVFDLANKALRGESLPGGVSLSGLAGAADAVNNAFDECRVPLRWSETDACGGARSTLADANTATFGTTANASSAVGKELMVKAYPNPFKDRVFISFTSPVSGKAVVEIFDMTGRRLEAINKGQVVAGRENTVEYTVPMSNRNSIIYRVTVDKFSVNGRLISPNK